ncbi:Phospholipase D1, partial [Ascosphaera pollenicola]
DTLDVVERQFEKFQEFAKTPEGLEAATCKFKKQCNLEISAAVEMASRFVLGQKDGTPRWKHFRKLHNPDARVFDVPIDFKTTDELDPTKPTKV